MLLCFLVALEIGWTSERYSARFTLRNCYPRFQRTKIGCILNVSETLLVLDKTIGLSKGYSAWFTLESCRPRFHRPKIECVVDVFATLLVLEKNMLTAKRDTACQALKSLLDNMLLISETISI
jgi:hypothetical protein